MSPSPRCSPDPAGSRTTGALDVACEGAFTQHEGIGSPKGHVVDSFPALRSRRREVHQPCLPDLTESPPPPFVGDIPLPFPYPGGAAHLVDVDGEYPALRYGRSLIGDFAELLAHAADVLPADLPLSRPEGCPAPAFRCTCCGTRLWSPAGSRWASPPGRSALWGAAVALVRPPGNFLAGPCVVASFRAWCTARSAARNRPAYRKPIGPCSPSGTADMAEG